jgi:hypothetical protein
MQLFFTLLLYYKLFIDKHLSNPYGQVAIFAIPLDELPMEKISISMGCLLNNFNKKWPDNRKCNAAA